MNSGLLVQTALVTDRTHVHVDHVWRWEHTSPVAVLIKGSVAPCACKSLPTSRFFVIVGVIALCFIPDTNETRQTIQ